MRVTFVLPTLDYSGGNRVVAMHAAGLIQRGHIVSVVVPRPVPQNLRESIGRLLGRPQANALTSGRKERSGSHVEDIGVIATIAQRSGPVRASDVPDADVIVATWWETAEWVQALPVSKGVKTYFVQGYEVFDYTPKDRVEATYRAPLRRITVSTWLQKKLARDFGDADVDLVPNGVDVEHFSCPLRGRQRRPTVGFMASKAPVKGLDAAVATLRRLHAEVPTLRVLACGREIFAPTEFGGVPVEYTRQPTQQQIRDLYASCDVWLAPSHSEGFGLPVLEAMACRTPVVSTRTGWPAQGIVDGFNGYLAEPRDDAALASHLSTVLGLDAPAWRRMSEAAHATASELTWPKSTAMFEAALMQAVAGSGRSTGAALASGRVQ